MKTKKFISVAALALTLSVCSLQPAITTFASNQVYSIERYGETFSPKSDVKRWIYKVENGKIYKRLYNASIDTWEGDWIYVGEYTG